MDQKKTGQFLKSLRNEKGLTQEQLAKQFNVSNRSVSRWETGTNLPDISLLVEIADFYDVDVREIIDGERKSEMMDKETREVAGKMADYAGNEKDRLLSFVQVAGIVCVVITAAALVLQTLHYEPDPARAGGVVATFIAFVLMCIITLYVTGLLQRLRKHRKAVKAIKITIIVVMALITHYVLMVVFVIGFFAASFYGAKVDVSTDVNDYNKYIHAGKNNEYAFGDMDIFGVFPEKISANAEVTEYQLTYYNPWDAQYVVYMTLDYKSGYEEEISRLSAIGIDDYEGIYTVTGEPEGYDLIAIDSDEYYGFTYAMIPEGAEDNTKITYCGIVFCNYFLDLDVHDYMPDNYLLPGFDATNENPYREEMLNK